jgi:hypothetical protein
VAPWQCDESGAISLWEARVKWGEKVKHWALTITLVLYMVKLDVRSFVVWDDVIDKAPRGFLPCS